MKKIAQKFVRIDAAVHASLAKAALANHVSVCALIRKLVEDRRLARRRRRA